MRYLIAILLCLPLLTGCHTNSSGWPVIPFLHSGNSQRSELTTDQRDTLHAFHPVKGANQSSFAESPAIPVRLGMEIPLTAITQREALTLAPLPDEDEGPCTNCVGPMPANATFTFKVVERAPGAHGGPYSYGLKRSFDGGKTWQQWTRWVNDTFRYDTPTNHFEQSVTLMCDGPTGKMIQVATWASNQP